MPQFARPDLDTTLGTYTDQAGGSTNIYTTIDEVTASDADFVRSVVSPINEVYVARLSDVVDPVSSAGHIIRVRSSTDQATGGETLDLTAQLRQTYVSEASQGTLIATLSRAGIANDTWTTTTYTLSAAEADAITDYTALFLRIVFNRP